MAYLPINICVRRDTIEILFVNIILMKIVHRTGLVLAPLIILGIMVVGAVRAQAQVQIDLVSPQSGSTGVLVPAALEVTVTEAGGQSVDVAFYGEVQASSSTSFTLIPIPDTQYYAELNNGIFEIQTQWIAAQKNARNIFFASHEGDIVDNWYTTSEWEIASTAMATLDPIVPYGINLGNHDMSTSTRLTEVYNQYFGPSRYAGKSWYKGSFPEGTNNNSYQIVSESGMDFLFLNLEFCPTAAVIQWANGVLAAHPSLRTVVTTHGYLDASGNRNISAGSGGCVGTSNNTQYIWDQLIYPNAQIFLVLTGHTLGESRRTDLNIAGKPVHQLLADYQGRTNGGDGWLRIMTFKPGEDKIYVETYSPTLNAYETDSNSKFTLSYDMDDYVELGNVQDVASGSNAQFTWSNLSPVTVYKWFVRALDGDGNVTASPLWSFKTEGNELPISRAGSDQTVTDTDKTGAEPITLDGSASSDPDGSIVAYEWKEGSVTLATTPNFTADFAVGTHSMVLTVTDSGGAQSSDMVVITVEAAPVIKAVHVGNITLTNELFIKGKNRSCRVTATVKALNQDTVSATGVTVAGAWSGAYVRTGSAVTDAAGNAVFRTNQVSNCGTFNFGVTNMSLSGFIYDSAANAETSDSITI
jgi:hypothetical protein